VQHFLLTGTYAGDTTSAAGARELGLDRELEQRWRDGILFEMAEPEPYSRAPYAAIYQDQEVLFKACAEFNRDGSALPMRGSSSSTFACPSSSGELATCCQRSQHLPNRRRVFACCAFASCNARGWSLRNLLHRFSLCSGVLRPFVLSRSRNKEPSRSSGSVSAAEA